MKSHFICFTVRQVTKFICYLLTVYVVMFSQVIASDVNQDGLFEILAIDNSGNIACRSLDGKMVSVCLLTLKVQ